MAKQADGRRRQVILGPVFAQEANAAGVAVAGRGSTCWPSRTTPTSRAAMSLSLGPTFDNTARRLAGYAVRKGKNQGHDRA
jgi:hypothetical protein